MIPTKLAMSLAVASSAVLLLSGCATEHSISAGNSNSVEWQVSVSQSSESDRIPDDVFDRVVKVDPQFKSGKYTAALLPLGQETVSGKKVTKFALSANLPKNCFTTTPDKNVGKGDCVDFTFAAGSPKVNGGRANTASDIAEIKTLRGVSTFEMTSPEDTDVLVVAVHTGEKLVRINPKTGEVMGGSASPVYVPHGR